MRTYYLIESLDGGFELKDWHRISRLFIKNAKGVKIHHQEIPGESCIWMRLLLDHAFLVELIVTG